MPRAQSTPTPGALRKRIQRANASAEMHEKWRLEGRMRKIALRAAMSADNLAKAIRNERVRRNRASMSAEKKAKLRRENALRQRERRAAMSAGELEKLRLQNALVDMRRRSVLRSESLKPTPLDPGATNRGSMTAAQGSQVEDGNEGVGKNAESSTNLRESDVEAFGYRIPLPSFLVTEQLLAELAKRKVFTEHVEKPGDEIELGGENFKRHCPLCTARFNTHPARQSHLSAAHGVRPKPFERFSCAHCFEEASSRSEFLTHMVKSHAAESVAPDTSFFYVCDFDACHLQFSDKDQFESHVALHGEWFRCEDCDRCFAREQNFNLHIERIHAGAKIDARPFVDCPFCVGVYVFKEFWPHLRNHALTLSTWEESNEGSTENLCDECGKVWSSEELLLRHVQVAHSTMKRGSTGGKGAHACNICSKKHGAKSYLHQHILRCHTYEHGTVCYVCQRKFKMLHTLHIHLRSHTGQLAVTNRHNCTYCTKVFGGAYIRNKHHFLAHGEQYLAHRPHHCVVCFVTFDTEEDRDIHYEGHAKFRCPLCSLHNLSQRAFDEHMKAHARPGNKTGDKKYVVRRMNLEERLRAVGDPLIGEKTDPKEETLRRLRENPENYFCTRRKARVENLESSLQQMEQAMSESEAEDESDAEEEQNSAPSTSGQVSTNQRQEDKMTANGSEADGFVANQNEGEGTEANQSEAEAPGSKTAKNMNPLAKRLRRNDAPKTSNKRNSIKGIVICLEAQLPFHCTKCSMQFSNESETLDHHTTDHMESCSNKNFPNLEQCAILKKYANPAFGAGHRGAFECTFCGQKFCGADEALKHRKAAHGIDASEETYRFACDICGRMFHEEQYLRKHKKIACERPPQPLKKKDSEEVQSEPKLVNEESGNRTCSICPPPNQFQTDKNIDTEISDPIALDVPQENESRDEPDSCVVSTEFPGTSHVPKLSNPNKLRTLETRVHRPENNQEKAPLNQFPCSTCHLHFGSSFDLKTHVDNVHGATQEVSVPPPTCTICRDTFTNWGGLHRHMRRLHREVIDANESEVQIVFEQSTKTKQLEAGSHGPATRLPPPVCAVCLAVFTKTKGLSVHMSRMHPGVVEARRNQGKGLHIYQCFKCSKTFDKQDEYEVHMNRTSHVEECDLLDDIFCSICQVTFLQEASLRQHLKTEHSAQEVERSASSRDRLLIALDLKYAFPCRNCDEKFPTQETLDLHAEFMHGDIHKPPKDASQAEHKCNLCPNAYKTGLNLTCHKNSVHAVQGKATGNFHKWKCGKCSLRFATQELLLRHFQSEHCAQATPSASGDKEVDLAEIKLEEEDFGDFSAFCDDNYDESQENDADDPLCGVASAVAPTPPNSDSVAVCPVDLNSILGNGVVDPEIEEVKIELDLEALIENAYFDEFGCSAGESDASEDETTAPTGQRSTFGGQSSMTFGQSSTSNDQSSILESSTTRGQCSKSKGQSSTSKGQRSSTQNETAPKGQMSRGLAPCSAYNVKYTTNERSMKNHLLKHLYQGLNDSSKTKAKEIPFAFLKLRKIETFSKFESVLKRFENSKKQSHFEQLPKSETVKTKESKTVKRSITPSRGHSPQIQNKRRRVTRSTEMGKKLQLPHSETEPEKNDSDWMPSEEEEELRGRKKKGQRSRSKSSRTGIQEKKKEIEERVARSAGMGKNPEKLAQSERNDSDWMPSEEEEELRGRKKKGQRSRSKSSRTGIQEKKKEIEERVARSAEMGKNPEKLAQSESESERNDSDWMPFEREEELKGRKKKGQRSKSKSSRTDIKEMKKEIEESESEDSDWSAKDGRGGASKSGRSLEVNDTINWECLECAVSFTTGNLLSDHRFQVHPTVSQRTCGICLQVFDSGEAMLAHRATAHAQDACELCAKKFDCLEFLLGHIERVHRGNPKPYKCEECGYCFRSPSYRRAHVESVHRIFAAHDSAHAFECEVCEQGFSSQSKLRAHQESTPCATEARSEKERFQCHLCSVSYTRRYYLRLHLRKHHASDAGIDDLATFTCDICPRRYDSQVRLNTHKERVHVGKRKPYKCDSCMRRYDSEVFLNAHKERVHAGNRTPYKCDICAHAFKHLYERTRHMESKHGVVPEDGISAIIKKKFSIDITSDYPCEFCDAIFRGRKRYNRHLRKHLRSDEARSAGLGEDAVFYTFLCDFEGCNTMIRGSEQFENHVWKHTALFACSECNRVFAEAKNLENHKSAIHTQEGCGLFACGFCTETFKSAELAETHQELHKVDLGLSLIGEHICDECGKEFSTIQVLNGHIVKAHGSNRFLDPRRKPHLRKEKRHECGICDNYSTCRKANFEAHMDTHTYEHGLTCFLCDEKCVTFQAILSHLSTQHSEPAATSSTIEISKRSVSRVYQRIRHQYSCLYCSYQNASNKELLLKHTYDNHREEFVRDNPFFCDLCYAPAASPYEVDVHRRTHDRLRCDICQQQFFRKMYYDTHMLSHEGKKPYQCSMCDKRFTTKMIRREHEIRHAKKYSAFCHICPGNSVGFYRTVHLTQHLEKVHGEGGEKRRRGRKAGSASKGMRYEESGSDAEGYSEGEYS